METEETLGRKRSRHKPFAIRASYFSTVPYTDVLHEVGSCSMISGWYLSISVRQEVFEIKIHQASKFPSFGLDFPTNRIQAFIPADVGTSQGKSICDYREIYIQIAFRFLMHELSCRQMHL